MLFNIDEKQLMLELKNKDERALKICMNKYYRYVVYIVENIIGSALPYEDKEAVVSNVFVALWNYSADLDTDNYSTFKDLIIGYVKDGIMYEGEVFDELSGKYSFSPDEKGEYFFYLLSGSSDYLSLKSGNLEVN